MHVVKARVSELKFSIAFYSSVAVVAFVREYSSIRGIKCCDDV